MPTSFATELCLLTSPVELVECYTKLPRVDSDWLHSKPITCHPPRKPGSQACAIRPVVKAFLMSRAYSWGNSLCLSQLWFSELWTMKMKTSRKEKRKGQVLQQETRPVMSYHRQHDDEV